MMLVFAALQLAQASVDAALAHERLRKAEEEMLEHDTLMREMRYRDMIDGGVPRYREAVLRLPPPAGQGV